MKPDFFIVGSKKSGTTWLLECLNYHPEICCFNEISFNFGLKDGIETLLTTFNNTQYKNISTTFKEFHYPSPQFTTEDSNKILEYIWETLIKKEKKGKKRIFGEKEPDYAPSIENLVMLYPEVKFIHIVRNPKDTAISYYHHILREKKFRSNDLTKPLNQRIHLNYESLDTICYDAITVWKRDQSSIETIKKRFPEKFITIKYEEINKTNLNLVYKHLGANSSEELAQNVLDATSIETRPKERNTFFTFGKPNNWQENLPNDVIQTMDILLGDWLKRYDYT